MKKIICILILSSLYLTSIGQSELDDRWGGFPDNSDTESDSTISAREASDVQHHKMTWRWAREGVYSQEVPLDTLLDGVHNYNYIFKKNISNTYLGNFSSPYKSNIFITRDPAGEFYRQTAIRAFLYKPEDIVHFNTTTPYTRFTYFTGGGRGKAENFLDAWHVQNINPFWSAGIRYNLISSDGRYMNQKAKSYNFSVYSSYERERAVLSLFLNQNNGHFDENGGIKERAYITDSTGQDAENIPIRLSGSEASNNYRNLNFQLQSQYNIGNKKASTRGKDTIYIYPAKGVFNFRVEGNEHNYKEKSINHDFYTHTYIDSSSTYDLSRNKIFDASAKLILNEHPRLRYLPGAYAGINYNQVNNKDRGSYDSINKTQEIDLVKYSNTSLTFGIFNVDTNTLLNYDIAGKLSIAGDYIGNFCIDGFVRQGFNKDFNSYIQADARIELKNANPFFNRYIGNHDIWDNDFKDIKTLEVLGKYVNKRLRTELGVGITNIWDHIYLDTTASPVQSGKNLTVLTAWADQNFRLGKFYFHQRVYLQKSSQKEVLSLPVLSLYSHNYYQNHLFNKALFLQFGFDVFYNTKFYSDNYMPSTMQFHNQRVYKTGNYPKVDLFLDFKIKRAALFAKYEHINYLIKDHGEFFSASDYPINPAMFKFGIRWDFHD